jgi:hypothetical protein
MFTKRKKEKGFYKKSRMVFGRVGNIKNIRKQIFHEKEFYQQIEKKEFDRKIEDMLTKTRILNKTLILTETRPRLAKYESPKVSDFDIWKQKFLLTHSKYQRDHKMMELVESCQIDAKKYGGSDANLLSFSSLCDVESIESHIIYAHKIIQEELKILANKKYQLFLSRLDEIKNLQELCYKQGKEIESWLYEEKKLYEENERSLADSLEYLESLERSIKCKIDVDGDLFAIALAHRKAREEKYDSVWKKREDLWKFNYEIFRELWIDSLGEVENSYMGTKEKVSFWSLQEKRCKKYEEIGNMLLQEREYDMRIRSKTEYVLEQWCKYENRIIKGSNFDNDYKIIRQKSKPVEMVLRIMRNFTNNFYIYGGILHIYP